MLVCAVLLLFSGCSGGGGGSDQSGTTSVVVDGGDGPVTVSLPANLYLMPGVGGNGEPDLAPVLQAKMIAVEPETAVAAFVVHEPVMTVEGSGYMWRWSSGDMSESLNLALGGNYGEEGRPLIGVLNYALEHTDVYIGSLALNLGHDLSTISDKYGRLNAESYEGAEDFEDMTAAEARALVEPRFIALGAAPKSLKLYKTLRLTKEQQERMLLDSPDWQSSAEEKRAALQNAYVLCYRQYFDGIPVNAADWHRTITAAEGMAYGSVAPMQEISASVYSNGDYRVFVRNLYEVTGASEKRAVISYGEALSRLADMYSETVLINPNYITEAELCYAVYDKGANNEAVLYPMWIFAVAADTHGTIGAYLKDGTEAAPGYPYGKVSSYGSVYAFDAYTGERIVNIKLRK